MIALVPTNVPRWHTYPAVAEKKSNHPNKFRFCGDGDCPDWVLAEIHSNLAQLTTDQLNELGEHTAKSILGADLSESDLSQIYPKGSLDAPKGAIACLRFLLTSAARYDTDVGVFGTELQQLGLPKGACGRLLAQYVQKIRAVFHLDFVQPVHKLIILY
ncbi:COMM domain-containing protein 4-like [Anopheles cruzii]|uniref:COMM domain-containing protein 4-like n=1 Tax=Anopheles cruzii TaxID=68878 RepID=UPI0022EC4CE0|nr:COMM domain-containing protein 4-like [Anopheles cruzii]